MDSRRRFPTISVMHITISILSYLLTASATINFVLYLKLKKIKKKPAYSLEARDLLRDLSTGPALIKIERIDPTSVFLHSPRAL